MTETVILSVSIVFIVAIMSAKDIIKILLKYKSEKKKIEKRKDIQPR